MSFLGTDYYLNAGSLASIKKELKQYINETREELHECEELTHHLLFNQDYYIIGYYNCSEWLKKHNVSELEGAAFCHTRERNEFGEYHTVFDNSETVVNHMVYWLGLDLCNELEISFG